MASAILPSRNDTRSSDFMSKFTNGALNFSRLQNIPIQNPNPKSNSNSSNLFIGNPNRDVVWKNPQQLPASAPPSAAFIGSSINSVPANSYRSIPYRYITFRLGSYTRRELKCLKKRLMSDLQRVRILRQFVCPAPAPAPAPTPAPTPTPKSNYHAPELQLPTQPEVQLPVNERQKTTIGHKRRKPVPPARDTKKQCGGLVTVAQRRKLMMRECGQFLGKLMKHKHGWVFNTPVNAAALKVYDYHNIINNPMDLGTIKSKLAKNEYESPLAFASDVRLTFENAMLYNGNGSVVYTMAECLLSLFEDNFRSNHQKFDVNQAEKPKISVETPVVLQAKVANVVENKPLMTEEEKAELAERFSDLRLGREGMDQIMSIVKKGAGLERAGNEIELDLAVLDNETLWELHSFIGRTPSRRPQQLVT
ncbi:hypothetical protein L1987_05631 [Smallanthus sonchifolius]|uniref:Uncharacterized protein n=1 Tax=Smallanthus sonchifolius TaxID=185202 RepID=A0ACB9JVX5_9ASTR|nr:hypothetical protein L1987_05631 [Smallanthus sonchifolius]